MTPRKTPLCMSAVVITSYQVDLQSFMKHETVHQVLI